MSNNQARQEAAATRPLEGNKANYPARQWLLGFESGKVQTSAGILEDRFKSERVTLQTIRSENDFR
jgi:hypothetical protein